MSLADWLPTLRYLLLGTFPHGPIGGLALSVLMAAASAVLSACLGLAGGIALAMTRGVAHAALLIVIGFFRAIPVLMLIFWTFFLLPMLLHINVPGLATVVCALALIGGAYLSHSVYAGVTAVGKGQLDAALSLGMTRWQALREVLLPQAVRIMLPSFVNQWVTLIKDTSLAYIVGVPELTFLANQVNNRLMVYPVQIFIFVGLGYWLVCTGFHLLVNRLIASRSAGKRDTSRPMQERIAQPS